MPIPSSTGLTPCKLDSTAWRGNILKSELKNENQMISPGFLYCTLNV